MAHVDVETVGMDGEGQGVGKRRDPRGPKAGYAGVSAANGGGRVGRR
ncbi:hypothetical protein ES705_47352 [subsurface metagenome]